MRRRCKRETCKDFQNYGGRGITVCESWDKDFQSFYDWSMQNGYREHLTIERIDCNGNYEPSNCTWIENEKQALNRRNTKNYVYLGEYYSVRELSEKFSINYNTFRDYLNKGKSVEQIIKNFN